MPAPSSMFGRQSLPSQISLNNNPRDSSVHQDTTDDNSNGYHSDNAGGVVQRSVVSPNELATSSVSSPSLVRSYDEMFVSKPVSEVKRILWEIKDFNTVLTNRIERAMNFEFEMGKLGSMERHLPRRSRWKVMFDVEEMGSRHIPAIRVLQLSPENKIIFYQIDACILERGNGTGPHPDKETDFRTLNQGYKEGLNETRSLENVFQFQFNSLCSRDTNILDQVRSYLCDGSLFLKVNMEILEDVST